MREILFRGKRISNGEWVYGRSIIQMHIMPKKELISFIQPANVEMHLETDENGNLGLLTTKDENEFFVNVVPETVCQYTGLDDKNGKKIFDGDIVKVFDRPRNRDVFGLIKFGIFAFNILFYIDWEKTLTGSNILRTELGYWHDKIEIIGNKFENPELCEVEE